MLHLAQVISRASFCAAVAFAAPVASASDKPSIPGWSSLEKKIIATIPAAYREHRAGFIHPATEDDIAQAIAFGTDDKEGRGVEYAYLMKGPSEFWNFKDSYVRVRTPLFLLAEHARAKAREYREPDPEFVDYCRKLDAVQIIAVEQRYTKDFVAFGNRAQTILLRDGRRVEPLTALPGYEGKNPFSATGAPDMLAVTKMGLQNAVAISGYLTPEMKQTLIQSYKNAGLSEKEIQDAFARADGTLPALADGVLAIGESDGIYSMEELAKPGSYELVFRTRVDNPFSAKADKEVRFPIDLARFR